MIVTILFLSTGVDSSEEKRIIYVVRSMVTAMNEKDADAYIEHLNDYFISQTYGSKESIIKNIRKFGHIQLLDLEVSEIKSYYSIVKYRLMYEDQTNKETFFHGEIVLDKTDEGWKIHSISENS